MKSSFTLLLCLLIITCLAQSREEWRSQLDTATSDTTIVKLYLKLGHSFQGRNKDSLVWYAKKAVALADKIGDPRALASGYNLMGNANFLESNYDTAIYYYSRGYDQAIRAKDSLRQGALVGNIGVVLTYQGKYDTSIHVLLQAKAFRESINDPKLSSTVNNLGNAYNRMADYEKALEYYKEAARLKEEQGQTRSLSNTLNNIGIILKNQEKYEEAISYYQRALEIGEEFKDLPKQANAHNNLATLYRDGNIDDALAEHHFRLAIKKKGEIGDKGGLFNSLMNYAELLSGKGRSKEALSMLEEAEVIEKELGETMYTINGLQMKANVLADLGRYEEAYQVYRQAYVKRVDAINEDRNEKIAEWETRFETAKKEAEIERLSLETDLQKAQLYNTRVIFVVGGGGAFCIIVLVLLLYFQRIKKHKVEQEAQELQIEALEKRLMDLNISPSETQVSINDLNEKIQTPLSEREFEVLKLSLEGKTNSEIAETLFVSISTIKFHLRNTYGKLGVNNRKEALDYVVKTS